MRSLWGVGPAGPIHFGYDTAAIAQAEAINEGNSHTLLFADLHVMMSHGLSYKEVRRRAAYYEAVFSAGYGIDARFLRGSDFQLSPDYISLLLNAATKATIRQLTDTLPNREPGARSSTTLAPALYSLMQCLDAVYLRSELVVADEGQRKIYNLLSSSTSLDGWLTSLIDHRADDNHQLAPTGYRYYPLMVDINGRRLNESTSKSRISIHESSDSLLQKVRGMYAPPSGQTPADNREDALLCYLKHSVFPWLTGSAIIETRDGAIMCDSFAQLTSDYKAGHLHPQDLKQFLFETLLDRTRRFRDRLATVSYAWIDNDAAASEMNTSRGAR